MKRRRARVCFPFGSLSAFRARAVSQTTPSIQRALVVVVNLPSCLHVQEKLKGRQSVVQGGEDERRTGDSQVNA